MANPRARRAFEKAGFVLEGDAAMREHYAKLTPRFEVMRDLALILNRKRIRRGSIDFDMPEANIELDPEGQMSGVSRAERSAARMRARSSGVLNGFVTKSSAPASSAFTLSASEFRAVSMTIATWLLARMARHASSPPMPGMFISSKTMSG